MPIYGLRHTNKFRTHPYVHIQTIIHAHTSVYGLKDTLTFPYMDKAAHLHFHIWIKRHTCIPVYRSKRQCFPLHGPKDTPTFLYLEQNVHHIVHLLYGLKSTNVNNTMQSMICRETLLYSFLNHVYLRIMIYIRTETWLIYSK